MSLTFRVSKDDYNPARAWVSMTFYWIVGLCIGYYKNYFQQLEMHITTYSFITVLATLICEYFISQRYMSYGRKRKIPPILIFAACNSLFETMIFLESYNVVRQSMYLKPPISIILGFASFSIYSGIIHKKFWEQHVFPIHTKPTAPSFVRTGLPLLVIMSASWLTLYELTHDILSICISHFVVDFWAGYQMGLPSPF